MAVDLQHPQRRSTNLRGRRRRVLGDWAASLLLVGLIGQIFGCSGCFDIPPYDLDQGFDSGNRAPILAPVGTHQVEEGQLFQLVLSAYDPEGTRLVFSAHPLPPGSQFDRQHGVLTWTPPLGASQDSPFLVEFTASDGLLSASSTGTFTVVASPVYVYRLTPDRIRQRGGTLVTAEGVGFEAPASVTIAGITGTGLTVVDRSRLTFVTPPLPGRFGPQNVILAFPNNRRVVLNNSLFVFTDDARLTGGVQVHSLPQGARLWAAGDVDSDLVDELVVGTDQACYLVDLDEQPPRFDLLLDQPVESVEVGHLDRDGLADVVVQTGAGQVVAFFSGRIGEVVTVHDSDHLALATALFDLEGDGDDDILVVDEQGNRLVYPAVSDGLIGPAIASWGPALPRRIQLVDLEGDQSADLLMELQDVFALAEGVETGVFREERPIAGSAGYAGPVVELEEGGLWPILLAISEDRVGRFGPGPSGDWGLDLSIEIPAIEGAESRRYLVDIEEDGLHEILTVPAQLPGFRLEKRSAELVQTAGWCMAGPDLGSPLTADLDGDGLGELLLLEAGGAQAVAIPTRPGTGELDAPGGVYTGGGIAVMTGDFLSNGYTDLVVAGTTVDGAPAHLLLRGYSGGWFWSDSMTLPATPDVVQLVLTDVTGDGIADVISTGEEGRITCYPSLGPAVYGPPVEIQLEHRAGGLVELKRLGTTSWVGVRLQEGGLILLYSTARCDLVPAQQVASDAVLVRSADIDGDGWSELLVLNEQGFLTVYRSEEGASYAEGIGIGLAMTHLADLASGHVTGADRYDLVIAGPSGVALLENALDSERIVDPEVTILSNDPAHGIALGDLNGDGLDEVVMTSPETAPSVIWWRDGVVEVRLLPSWHSAARSPVLADLDRDNDLELITLHPGFGAILWRNDASP
ncbi:MAG: VCBS repeat-containing protein [Bradymonadales bacterium]|nr:VCBS repeat-containing protein [Bradymonadales bacterium]